MAKLPPIPVIIDSSTVDAFIAKLERAKALLIELHELKQFNDELPAKHELRLYPPCMAETIEEEAQVRVTCTMTAGHVGKHFGPKGQEWE